MADTNRGYVDCILPGVLLKPSPWGHKGGLSHCLLVVDRPASHWTEGVQGTVPRYVV